MSEYAETTAKEQTTDQRARELPERIVIPPIKGEMVHLRPATIDDIARMEVIEAYVGASGITGKDRVAEGGAVSAWVRRSVAWSNGEKSNESGVGDPESRRTIAWSIVTEADHDGDGELDAASSDNVIGMIFLIDIDGWARSARIQVVLGKDYRGRGYSRDIMPRVMTYGFAPEPAGLGMHRIWVAVPEQNTRSVSVYQSLGFVPSGRSRDALWNASENRYQDLIVMDTLVDEFDPIRSLDAFGMHVIEDNPGEYGLGTGNAVYAGDADLLCSFLFCFRVRLRHLADCGPQRRTGDADTVRAVQHDLRALAAQQRQLLQICIAAEHCHTASVFLLSDGYQLYL